MRVAFALPVEGYACAQQPRQRLQRHVPHPSRHKVAAMRGQLQHASQGRLPHALISLALLLVEESMANVNEWTAFIV